MQSISTGFSKALLENSTLLVKASLKLADGTTKELTGDDITALSYEQATSSDQSFDVGSAIIGKCSVTLNNHDRRFDDYDFTGAKITPYVGKTLGDSTTEWLRKGTYAVDQPDSYGGTIKLSCLDYLTKLEKPYSSYAGIGFPCSAYDLLYKLFKDNGLTLDDSDFDPAYDPTLTRRPSSTSLSLLQVASYLAQMCGGFIRCMMDKPRAKISWYDTGSIEQETWLDGGDFSGSASPYDTGSAADGGSFSDYTSGDSYDGGSFTTNKAIGHIYMPKSVTVMTDDVVITGVRVTAQNEIVTDANGKETNGRDGETYLAGSEGYVISIANNPFIEYGTAQACAEALYKRVGGMKLRPFTATAPSDPSIEAGDPVVVSDYTGAMHASYVTSLKLSVNNSETFKCSAKSASRNSAASASASTQAIVETRNEIKRSLNSIESAKKELETKIGEKSGLYHTEETIADGSTIYYLHDKPTIGTSGIIWKMNGSAVSVSKDGGKTWKYGVTADGDAILERVYAKGIDADYIKSGTLDANLVSIKNQMLLGDDNNNVRMSSSGLEIVQGGRRMSLIGRNEEFASYVYSDCGIFSSWAFDITHDSGSTALRQVGREYVSNYKYYIDGNKVYNPVELAGNDKSDLKYEFCVTVNELTIDGDGNRASTLNQIRSDKLTVKYDSHKDSSDTSADNYYCAYICKTPTNNLTVNVTMNSVGGVDGPYFNLMASYDASTMPSNEKKTSGNVTTLVKGYYVQIVGVSVKVYASGYGMEFSVNGSDVVTYDNIRDAITGDSGLEAYTGSLNIMTAYNNMLKSYGLTFKNGLLLSFSAS